MKRTDDLKLAIQATFFFECLGMEFDTQTPNCKKRGSVEASMGLFNALMSYNRLAMALISGCTVDDGSAALA